MKKLFTIMIGILLGSQSYAETGATEWPLLPNKNYDAEQVFTFSHTKTPATLVTEEDFIREDWVKNLLKMTNDNLARAHVMQVDDQGRFTDQALVVDGDNLHWIIVEHSYDSSVILQNFSNSRKATQFASTVDFFTDPAKFTGKVRVFHYLNCRFIIYKTECTNLMGIPLPDFVPITVHPYKMPDITDTTRVGGVTVVNNIYNNNSIENSGNSTNTVGGTPTGGTTCVVDDVPQQMSYPTQRYYRERPIQPTRGYFQVSLNINSRQQQRTRVYHPQQQQPVRTGGHPVPGNNGGNNGGGLAGGGGRTSGYRTGGR